MPSNRPDGGEAALYNSKIVENYIRLIKKSHPGIDIGKLLAEAGMEFHQIEDQGHWFTQSQIDRFHDCLARSTNDQGIAREAGRFNASPEGIGVVSRYVLGLAGPARVFEIIGKIAANFTRSTRFASRRIGKNQIELTVTPRAGVAERRYQCENRMGYFEAIVAGFNHRSPRIEHPECVFEGGSACRYLISWRPSKAAAAKTARNILAALCVTALPILALAARPDAFAIAAIAVLASLISLAFAGEMMERRELASAMENLRSTNETLFENAERNYNQALMVNEIGHVISKTTKTDPMLSQVMDILGCRLDYDRGLIMLGGEGGRSLEYRAGFGYGAALVEKIKSARFSLDNSESKGVFVLCYREKRPILVNDVERIEGDLSRRSLEFLREIGSKSFISYTRTNASASWPWTMSRASGPCSRATSTS